MTDFLKRVDRLKTMLEGQERTPVVIVYTDGREETTTMLEAVIKAGCGSVVDFRGDGIGETAESLLRAMISAGSISVGDIAEAEGILKADTIIIDDIV